MASFPGLTYGGPLGGVEQSSWQYDSEVSGSEIYSTDHRLERRDENLPLRSSYDINVVSASFNDIFDTSQKLAFFGVDLQSYYLMDKVFVGS